MLGFSSAQEINSFFDGWYDLPENQRLNLIRALRKEGTLGLVQATAPEFSCPINAFPVVKSCGVKSCQFHLASAVNLNTHKNCAIHCLSGAKGSRLTPTETASLLGISLKEVNSIGQTSLNKIRRAVVRENVEKHQVSRFSYLQGHCVSCGMTIRDELDLATTPELVIEVGAYGWCSTTCKTSKPEWQFKIELEFRCHYIQALAIGALLYRTSTQLEEIFGLPVHQLKHVTEELELAVQSLK